MKSHREIFSEIYAKNVWGGSGGGSTPENTKEYRAFLQRFLRDRKIKSVVDYGCGDWMFSRLVDWSGINYFGIDCVESVINENKKRFESGNIKFECAAGINSCQGDLLIVKDVLQHWSNADIVDFLTGAVPHFNYILITNSNHQSSEGEDIHPGESRGLSANFYPLKQFSPAILGIIKTTIVSEVSLITKQNQIII